MGLGLAAVHYRALGRPNGAHARLWPSADPAEALSPHHTRYCRLVHLDEAVQLRRDQLRQVSGYSRHPNAIQSQVLAIG